MARSPDAPRELFDRLTRQARLTAKTPDAAQVHNLRVAIRRFSQAMAMLPEETPGVASIHRKLKKTMTLAGAVRDADIAIKLVAKLKPAGAKAFAAAKREREAAAGFASGTRAATRHPTSRWVAGTGGDASCRQEAVQARSQGGRLEGATPAADRGEKAALHARVAFAEHRPATASRAPAIGARRHQRLRDHA